MTSIVDPGRVLRAEAALQRAGVALRHDVLLEPGVHPMKWADFTEAFGITPQRAHMIQDLQFGLEGARRHGATKAWIGGSLVRFDKLEVGDVDLVVDTPKAYSIGDAVAVARGVPPNGGQTHHQVSDHISAFPTIGRGDADNTGASTAQDAMVEFFMKDSRAGGPARGVVELDLDDVPRVLFL